MDGEDRIVRAELPAAIDHLLAAALHLGVLALHRGEVEQLVTAPRSVGGRGAAAEADEHRRSAEHDKAGARLDGGLANLIGTDVADPARNHDGLVVAVSQRAAVFARFVVLPGANLLEVNLESAEVSAECRASELVVERGGPDGAVEHDLERGSDMRRPVPIVLPWLDEVRNPQVRH